MGWIEDRFRRKFERRPEGYLYRQSDREVILTREEVEDLVAEWRRYWHSPILWGGWMLFGIVLPFIAITADLEHRDLAIIAGGLANVVPVVMLAYAWRGPTELAFTRPSVGPGRGATGVITEIIGFMFGLLQLGMVDERSGLYPLPYLTWGLLSAYTGFLLLKRFIRWRKARAA
ncbi:hypothetical protein P1X14_05195 [Sphingomonas sp. AOB5]|uniref:hypothetical protein n=1 Tax=Sphingomonas sp. AOB5 TaxID=3034017 RepID=UPI0023F90978|nr:hypothetical protein [Sphingomonas sp. AOB5]MDF7774634.1 hypothetical protein [Sphingomonas sp. AOB5]